MSETDTMGEPGVTEVTAVELGVIEMDRPPDDFLPDEPEGAAFHRAWQNSGIAAFDCRYLAIFSNGIRIAIVPYFTGRYSLSTMLPKGMLESLLGWIKFNYVCVGHPSTDFGLIQGEISAELLALVNATLAKKNALIAYKGFSDKLPLQNFVCTRGLPVAVLTLAGDYFSMLNGRRRYDYHHKRQAASALRFEEHTTLPEHLLPAVFRLYLDTLTHAEMRFEILTPEYFSAMSGVGKFHLYFEGERLIGFLQLITRGAKANLKYIGMDHLRHRQYFLYFVMCIRAIQAAQREGCTRIELGVSSYQAKQLMGCEQVATSVYFRHSNPLANWLLCKCKFLIEPGRDELR